MANWMGGRLAAANYAASNEAERERRRAADRARPRATERRDDADRNKEPQPRGALSRAIQPIEQPRRKRGRRGGEETALMDSLRTAATTAHHRSRDQQYRDRGRDDSRDRAGGDGRGAGRRGDTGRTRDNGSFEDRHIRGEHRASAYQAGEDVDSCDEDEGGHNGRRWDRSGARYGEGYHDYQQESVPDSPYQRRRRGWSPRRNNDDDQELARPFHDNHHLRPSHRNTGQQLQRFEPGREDRQIALRQPPPLNAYQRAQIERQQHQQQSRLMASERLRANSIRQAEEDEARLSFLTLRRRSPPFVVDPPPHVIQPKDPPQYMQHLLPRRRDEWPPPAVETLLSGPPARFHRGSRPERSDDKHELPAWPVADLRMRRPPGLRTPSPPRTPRALSQHRGLRQHENAFFRARPFEALYSTDHIAMLASGCSHPLVPWAKLPTFRAPQSVRVPPAPAPPRLQLAAVEARSATPLAQRAAVEMLPSPSSPVVFRPEPPPHMRPDKRDGGRKAPTTAPAERKKANGVDNHHSEGRQAEKTQAADVSVMENGELPQQQQQHQQDQTHNSQPAAVPQSSQPEAGLSADCQGDIAMDNNVVVEQPLQSSADIEAALAHCEGKPAADEKTTEAVEVVAPQQQPIEQQPSSPIIDVIDVEAEAEAETKDDPAPHEQSETDSAVSSHYAFVGPAKYDGSPWVKQLLTDNGIHVVEFDDERCNIAFLESDYSPAQLGQQPMPVEREADIIFYDMQYIRDTAVGEAGELAEYRLSKPSERS